MIWKLIVVMLAAAGVLGTARASAADPDPKIKTEPLLYKDGDTVLRGYLAYDQTDKSKRPGVVVFSEWYGLNDYAKSRARQLAAMGYVALAADMYGDGKVALSNEEAAGLAEGLRKHRDVMRTRALLALTELKRVKIVDPYKTAAIGYCLGGTVVLEMARGSADTCGVVSFHGGLDTPNAADAKNIKCKILVLTGAKDPHVDANQLAAFQKEMTDANVDWHLIVYSGAVHGFTNPANGDKVSSGVAYNANADRRSWEAMKSFFAELFNPPVTPAATGPSGAMLPPGAMLPRVGEGKHAGYADGPPAGKMAMYGAAEDTPSSPPPTPAREGPAGPVGPSGTTGNSTIDALKAAGHATQRGLEVAGEATTKAVDTE
jgi:dienelactone hydrolase